MSIREKIQQKKHEKIEEKVGEISGSQEELKARRAKIAQLKEDLLAHYDSAEESLGGFKEKKSDLLTKKQELGEIYKEGEDILAEEGIKDANEMIEAYPKEKEAVEYHQAEEGKGKKREELKKGVVNVSELKKALQEELSDLDLKFTGGKKEEGKSNREISFEKIDNYLKELDKEGERLEEEKANTKMETPEGRKKLCLQEIDLKKIFGEDALNYRYHMDEIKLGEEELKLGEKYGEDIVKEIIKEALQAKVEQEVFSSKSSEDKEKIRAYSSLEKIANPKYIDQEIRGVKDLELKAKRHLKTLLEDEKVMSSFLRYFRTEDLDELTNKYLPYVSRMNNFPADIFEHWINAYDHNKELIKNREVRDYTAPYDPQSFRGQLELYRKLFQYILDKTDVDTKFLPDSNRDDDGKSLLERFDNKKKQEKKLGYKEEDYPEETKLTVSSDYMRRVRSFDEALIEAKRENKGWEKEKEDIEKSSELAVEATWAGATYDNYEQENDNIFKELETLEKNREELNQVFAVLEPLPAEIKKRIITVNEEGVFDDVTANKDYEENKGKLEEIHQERLDYIESLRASSQAELDNMSQGWFSSKKKVNSLKARIADLESRAKRNYGEFDNTSRDLNPKEIKRKHQEIIDNNEHLSPEEAQKLYVIYQKKQALHEDYDKKDQERLDFREIIAKFPVLSEDNPLRKTGEMTVGKCERHIKFLSQNIKEELELKEKYPEIQKMKEYRKKKEETAKQYQEAIDGR